MENYFNQYKGYTKSMYRRKQLILYTAIAIVALITWSIGLTVILICLSRGMTIKEISSKAPVVVGLSIASIVVSGICFIYVLCILFHSNPKYIESYVLLDNEKKLNLDILCKEDKLIFKTSKKLVLYFDMVTLVKEDKVCIQFQLLNKDYYILMNLDEYNRVCGW